MDFSTCPLEMWIDEATSDDLAKEAKLRAGPVTKDKHSLISPPKPSSRKTKKTKKTAATATATTPVLESNLGRSGDQDDRQALPAENPLLIRWERYTMSQRIPSQYHNPFQSPESETVHLDGQHIGANPLFFADFLGRR